MIRANLIRRSGGWRPHILVITFLESEEAGRAFARDDISAAKYYDFDKDFLLEGRVTLHALRDI
jgi:hypothetical protein